MEKAVAKYMIKRLEKAVDLVAECEVKYVIKLIYDNTVKLKHLKKLRKKLYTIKEQESIVFVHGSGKRKTELQKSLESLEEHQAKIKDYTYKIHISGKRNSYSKTDSFICKNGKKLIKTKEFTKRAKQVMNQ